MALLLDFKSTKFNHFFDFSSLLFCIEQIAITYIQKFFKIVRDDKDNGLSFFN